MTHIKKTTKPPLVTGGETFGQRLSRIRKEKGLTQVELAEKMDIIQVLISDYERDKLRPYYDTVINFSKALGVTTDELLGMKPIKMHSNKPDLKIAKRMKKIEALAPTQQKAVLKNIDIFLKGIGVDK